ncbi:cupin domain-containing protein [Paenibacillus sp. SC116]|uniref:cupin domain-containing protein n=1 Tax=Paenibacillus sp. SC116 TaxID=2968986 RepID=UPI00215B1761|nr:cupin domain-containing protein [Paenibacillus sp. SC116]MCR8842146.1 cupin domain-containing protein [Paenibacillus sp. SC116]
MYIQALKKECITEEYGVQMRRVYQVNTEPFHPPFGSAWAIVKPGETSAPHVHHEHETFYITAGAGTMIIGEEEQKVQTGDVIYIPPHEQHALRNDSENEDLIFITTWWE